MNGAFILDGAHRTSLQLLRSFKKNSILKVFMAKRSLQKCKIT